MLLNNIKLMNKILAIIIGLLLLCSIILSLTPVKISMSKGQGMKADIRLSKALTPPAKKQEEYNILASGRLFGLMKQTPITSSPEIERPLIIGEKKPCLPPPEVIYSLQGVIHGSQGAIAVIRASNQAQNVFVKCGDTLDSYQVTRITKDSLVLKRDGQERIVYLEYPH
ncbi:MAG: hypothetical protein QME49_02860 [bacterium]|nr:hypothetical protein [bacterium]